MRLKGKIAIWFYGIILLVVIVEIPILIVSLWIEPSILGTFMSLIVLISVETFCLSIVFRNYVEFKEDSLLIVFGFIKKSITYHEIIDISMTKEPWSSLAASLDRIKIKTKTEDIMISVVDKESFFNKIQSIKK